MSDFKGRHFTGDVVLWAVRWYCRYGGWVQKYAPGTERRMRWQWRRPMSDSGRVDETDIKVRGTWTYLYRAVDNQGNTIDFYLSSTRIAKAAKCFLGKASRAGFVRGRVRHHVPSRERLTILSYPIGAGIRRHDAREDPIRNGVLRITERPGFTDLFCGTFESPDRGSGERSSDADPPNSSLCKLRYGVSPAAKPELSR